jgi:AcrR family transcriptional regulator
MATVIDAAAKKRRRQETRQRLLDAALSVFARNGYERATVDEIVREAGFSKGAFYVHFESKEDLFWAILEARIEAQQSALRQALDPNQPIVVNQRRLFKAVFALDKQDPSWRAVVAEFAAHAARNQKVRQRLGQLYERWHRFTVEILHAGQELGHVRRDLEVEFMASVTMALIEGAMMQSRLAPPHIRLDKYAEPLAQLIADWLEGFPARSGDGPPAG